MLINIPNAYKNAYKGLSKNNWCLSMVMLINRSGAMVVPFMGVYCINKLQFTVVQSGMIMTLFGIGAMSGVLVGGRLNRIVGFYNLQIVSLLGGGLLFIIVGYLDKFINLSIGIFFLSLFNEAFRPANSLAISHFSAIENKARSYSLNRLAVNLGWSIGGALGGILASVNYNLLFWFDGITNILAAIVLIKLIPRPNLRTSRGKSPAASFSVGKDYVFLIFTITSTLFSICFFQFITVQPLFYKLKWHFSERGIGALISVNGIIIVLFEMMLIHYIEQKKKQMIYIISGVLLAGIGYLLFNLLPGNYSSAVICIVLISIGEMLCLPFMNTFWIRRAAGTNRSSYVAVYSLSWTSAQIIAPAFGSYLIKSGGFEFMWNILSSTSLAAAICFVIVDRYIDSRKVAF